MGFKSEQSEKGRKVIPVEEGLFEYEGAWGKSWLIGAKCKQCGLKVFPKTAVCPRCLKKDTMEKTKIGGKGTLDSFSIVQTALPGFKAPSIQAYIKLDEGPRIWSLITGCTPVEEALRPGMEMELVIAKIREDPMGNEIFSYFFKPAK